MPNRRSTLTASGAERWMACPGSVRLSENIPYSTSKYADEGTAAHALGEQIISYALKTSEAERGLRQRFKAGTTITYKDHGETKSLEVTQEMLDHVMVYVNHITQLARGPKATVHLEVSVKHRNHARNAYADAIVDLNGAVLVVADFKYGYTPVHVHTERGPNPQVLYYAAGALEKFGWKHKHVSIQIVQPRCQEVAPVQEHLMEAADVKRWMENELWEAMMAVDADDAPLNPGDHCRFCPALGSCPAVHQRVEELAKADFAELAYPKSGAAISRMLPVPLNDDELAKVLRAAPMIDAWLRECESWALNRMQSGHAVPGFKLVRKRANREWPSDVNTAAALARRIKAAGGKRVNAEDLLTEPELISPAKADKLVGKEIINTIAVKPETGLTVAAESDKRDAVNPASDFEELM